MRALLGLDVGITRAHAVAIDEAGHVVAAASADYRRLSPAADHDEQDAAEWWRASREALGRVAAAVGGDVAGVGVTGQSGCVFLSHRGEVVRPALAASDRRSANQCDDIARRIGRTRLIDITGNPALPGFQAPRILWLRDVEPVQYRHTGRVLAAKDYLRLLLTGEAVTDVTEASGTMLLDLRRRTWSQEVVSALEIVPEWLPSLQESPEISGGLRRSVADDLGLPPGIPVAAGAAAEAA